MNTMITSNHIFLKLIQPELLDDTLHFDKNILIKIGLFAKKTNLLMLLYVQLRRYNKDYFNNENIRDYLKELKPIFLTNASICIKQEAEENNIVSQLASKNIPALVIKGNQIARHIYQDPYCRTSSDIDILIKESDVLTTDTILEQLGYNRTDTMPLKFWTSRIHHSVYINQKTRTIVEIHWNFGVPSFFNLTSEEIWKEIKQEDNGRFTLSPDMLLIKLIIHHSLHAYKELKILTDILWTMHRYKKIINWQVFAQKLKRMGMAKASLITLNQIQTLWNDFSREFQPIIALHRKFSKLGCRRPKFLSKHFKIDLGSTIYIHTKDQFFVRFTLDRWFTILFSFIKTFFPLPNSIRELYNDKRTWTLPLNYFKFFKWRVTSGHGH